MTAAQTISAFVLERLNDEPVARQIELYGALAELTPDSELNQEMHNLADELRKINGRQMQLRFRAAARGNYIKGGKR